MRMVAIVLSIMGILYGGLVYASEQPRVVSAVVPNNITIGTPISYTLHVYAPARSTITLPDMRDAFKGFDIVTSSRKQSSTWWSTPASETYSIKTFTPGNYTVPSVVVRVKPGVKRDWINLTAAACTVEVASMLAKSPAPVLRGIKGMVLIVAWYWIVIIALVCVLVIGVLYIRFRKSSNNAGAPVIVRPAYEVALEQLEELARKDLPSQGKWKEYFSGISNIVRHYLEQGFAYKAPEMTTEEFLAHARETSYLTSVHKELLKDFLVACDMVKFAKYVPAPEEGAQVYDAAHQFVVQTKKN